MGIPGEGSERRTFVGVSNGTHGDPAKIDEALESLAEQIVSRSQFVTETTGPTRFDVTFIEVEVENQNIRTLKIGVTEK